MFDPHSYDAILLYYCHATTDLEFSHIGILDPWWLILLGQENQQWLLYIPGTEN
jgi:hypothetical protein